MNTFIDQRDSSITDFSIAPEAQATLVVTYCTKFTQPIQIIKSHVLFEIAIKEVRLQVSTQGYDLYMEVLMIRIFLLKKLKTRMLLSVS